MSASRTRQCPANEAIEGKSSRADANVRAKTRECVQARREVRRSAAERRTDTGKFRWNISPISADRGCPPSDRPENRSEGSGPKGT